LRFGPDCPGPVDSELGKPPRVRGSAVRRAGDQGSEQRREEILAVFRQVVDHQRAAELLQEAGPSDLSQDDRGKTKTLDQARDDGIGVDIIAAEKVDTAPAILRAARDLLDEQR
jgi:hypothetical protein